MTERKQIETWRSWDPDVILHFREQSSSAARAWPLSAGPSHRAWCDAQSLSARHNVAVTVSFENRTVIVLAGDQHRLIRERGVFLEQLAEQRA